VSSDDFDAVRRDPDPLRRGRRATELLALYQQRSTELARLRKAAVEEAHRQRGMSYTEIAEALGITKGRVTQLRGSAPAPERAFFGIGPVTVALPLRTGEAGRERILVAAEDVATADQLDEMLAGLALTVTRMQMPMHTAKPPSGDAVVICGPKSAPVGGYLLGRDPCLGMVQGEGRWWMTDTIAGERYGSPGDEPDPTDGDLAYLARHQLDGRIVVHIAGIHSVGSLGVAHYLSQQLPELFAAVGETEFSAAVRCTFDDLEITASEVVAGPYRCW